MGKKRERLEVIKDILMSIQDKGKIKPTRMLFASNLSHQMFKEYTSDLLHKGFIELTEKDKKKYYILTDRGYQFLEEYHVIEDFMSNFGL